MVDTSGMADIRGLDVDKLAKGFAEEELVLKRFVQVSNTSAREIRWYQKTAGFITGTTTTDLTADPFRSVSERSLPSVAEQSWTRTTSYVRKYFVESPWLSDEDIKDSDIDILATNVRDLVRAVENQVDARIWNILTENQKHVNINLRDTSGAWDGGGALPDPILDIMQAKKLIRNQSYDPEGAILFLSPEDHKSLLWYLISLKGSSIPAFASQKVQNGVVMEILGVNVVVSTNVTADYAALVVNQRAAIWKSFMPIKSALIEDKGIGTKIRVWEEGECILTDPKAVTLISGTQT